MTVENINVEATIKRVNDLIAAEPDLSPALKASLEVLLLLVTILSNRLGLNSKNSSKPPSSDPNRKKELKEPSERKPGGQHGHIGTTLKPVSDPDQIKEIKVDRKTLPQGNYRTVGYESRQVFDLDISTVVTEWRAEILEDQNGKRYVAPFPKDVARPVQYGIGVKVNAVYMSQYQLIHTTVLRITFWIRWVFRSVPARSTTSTRMLLIVWNSLRHGSKSIWYYRHWFMRMKPASMLEEPGFGCIMFPMIVSLAFILTTKEVVKR